MAILIGVFLIVLIGAIIGWGKIFKGVFEIIAIFGSIFASIWGLTEIGIPFEYFLLDRTRCGCRNYGFDRSHERESQV